MVRVIEGKIIMENELRVNENWFESEREFELSRVRVTEGKITVMQGKSILVRVSASFELARVRVIWSRLYFVMILLRYGEGGL